jgi:hypothetical protein
MSTLVDGYQLMSSDLGSSPALTKPAAERVHGGGRAEHDGIVRELRLVLFVALAESHNVRDAIAELERSVSDLLEIGGGKAQNAATLKEKLDRRQRATRLDERACLTTLDVRLREFVRHSTISATPPACTASNTTSSFAPSLSVDAATNAASILSFVMLAALAREMASASAPLVFTSAPPARTAAVMNLLIFM